MYLKQYELWQTCNNNCAFCFNKENAGKSDNEAKKAALRAVIADLDIVPTQIEDELSIELIGGEFFQGQMDDEEVNALFFQLIDKLVQLRDEKKIAQVVLFVTLTIGAQKDLYKALAILTKDAPENFEVWVSTSYDTEGRFNKTKLANWKKHMGILASTDKIHRNTTIIVTQAFVDSVLSGEFNFREFQDTYKTTLFFKHPLIMLDELAKQGDTEDQIEKYKKAKKDMIKRLPWFLPKRKDTLKVIVKMKAYGLLNRLMGLEYRADDLDAKFGEVGHWVKTRRDKANDVESENETKLPCGHLVTYMCYSGSDKCLLCDRDLYNDD